jgi:hypothetical protein
MQLRWNKRNLKQLNFKWPLVYGYIVGNKFINWVLIACGLCNSAFAAQTRDLPKHYSVPGGVAVLALSIQSAEPPEVYFQNKRTMVIADPKQSNHWLSIIGIPLDITNGIHSIKISTAAGLSEQNFEINNKKYPQEKLTIQNKRKVEPLPEDLLIIEAQYLETIKTYEHWQYQPLASLHLSLPVKGRKSSPFGLTRIMNNIPQNPHSGLDIAAAKGTPVQVAKAGTVINLGNFFYSGKIVFVDHGQGFITSYCHLDSILVNKGQQLQTGDIIGTIGNTGRATGAHLHWSVSLNGVRVDPQLFIYE